MSRDGGVVPKTIKHPSASKSFTKPNRRTFQKSSGSSSLSSNRDSSAQSDYDNGIYFSQSVKNITVEDKDSVIKKLQSQLKKLRRKVRILMECVENKDKSLGTVTREKDRAAGEIRRLERNNKQLRQQLSDERNHYLEEKGKFCEEMSRYKKRLQELKMVGKSNKSFCGLTTVGSRISLGTWQKGDSAGIHTVSKDVGPDATGSSEFRKSASLDSLGLYEGGNLALQMAALRTENAKLRAIVNEEEERNYELCLRFLRMKHSKNDLRNRFQDLENEYLQVITNLMEKIEEAREEFSFIIDQKFKKPLHSTNAKYLRLIQRNSKIAFENTTLRMELQNLKRELNKRDIGQGDYGRYVPYKKKTEDETKNESLNEKTKKPTIGKNDRPDVNLIPKASDTDCMSKTSTTTSLGDVKSNESIYIDALASENVKNKAPQNTFFTEEVLQKIFKWVNSQSSINSARDLEKENRTVRANIKNRDKRKSAEDFKPIQNEQLEKLDIPPLTEEGLGKRYVRCSLNNKKYHEITAQSMMKKPVPAKKEKRSTPPNELNVEKEKPIEINKPKEKLTETIRETIKPKTRSHYTEIKGRVRSYTDADRTANSPKEGTIPKETSSWDRIGDKKSINDFVSPRRHRLRKERRQRLFVADSCGLEEKLDSDGELSIGYEGDEIIDQLGMDKERTPGDLGQTTRERMWHEPETNEDTDFNIPLEDSAVASGVKIRKRNSISLHDELMEATKSQNETDGPFWRRELILDFLLTKMPPSSSGAYHLDGTNTPFSARDTYEASENFEDEHQVTEVKTTVRRKDEGQQSHSSNPQKESKQESKEQPPRNFKHSVTDINAVLWEESSDVHLRFLMPPEALMSAQSFLYDKVYKESSTECGGEDWSPGHSVQRQIPQILLERSNFQSSSKTIDTEDCSTAREHNLIQIKSQSAPALIQSEWRD